MSVHLLSKLRLPLGANPRVHGSEGSEKETTFTSGQGTATAQETRQVSTYTEEDQKRRKQHHEDRNVRTKKRMQKRRQSRNENSVQKYTHRSAQTGTRACHARRTTARTATSLCSPLTRSWQEYLLPVDSTDRLK